MSCAGEIHTASRLQVTAAKDIVARPEPCSACPRRYSDHERLSGGTEAGIKTPGLGEYACRYQMETESATASFPEKSAIA